MTVVQARVDLMIDGAWSNVSADVNPSAAVVVERGRSDEASRVDPSTAKLTFNNQDRRYSRRNPLSPLYGKIGRNTPLRLGVGVPPAGAGSRGQTGTSIVAPSVTAETTGAVFCVWAAAPVGNVIGPAGFTMGAEQDGSLSTWAAGSKTVAAGATGTATATHSVAATSASAISVFIPGVAITATGVSAVTLAGLGNTLGVTTVAGNYVLAVYGWSADPGDQMTNAPADADGVCRWSLVADSGPSTGPRIKAFLRKTDITGVQNIGFWGAFHSGPDVYARAWVITGATDFYHRFTGEVSDWPSQLLDLSAGLPVTASGILRRLGQGDTPLRSAVRREIPAEVGTALRAYWPMEDAAGATSFASALSGGPAMTYLPGGTAPALAADSGFICSDPLPTFTGAGARGSVPPHASTNAFTVGALVSLPAAGSTDESTLLAVNATGTARVWTVKYEAGAGGFRVEAFDEANASLANLTIGPYTTPPAGGRFLLYLSVAAAGADISWILHYLAILPGDDYPTDAASPPSTIVGQTVGRVTTVTVGAARDLTADPTIGHVLVASSDTALFTTGIRRALVAFNGETADVRISRLCQEESVPVHIQLDADSQLMGPQRAKPLLDLLTECEAVDGGILYEPRGLIGLGYRTLVSMFNQSAQLTLTDSEGAISDLQPVDDDQGVINDVTVTRPDGSSARAALDVGPLSTLPPPDGVGRYDTTVEVNVVSDVDLPAQAAWRLHRGTIDEERYPGITANLVAAPAAVPAVTGADQGDLIEVVGLPVTVNPGTLEQIALGYTETFTPEGGWLVSFNAVPASAYRVAELDSDDFGRLDSEDSTLGGGATSSTTTINVSVDTGSPQWITTQSHPSEFPFDIKVGGEVMTVSGIIHGISDVFARTVANGWGTADAGGAWTIAGGVSADYAVGSGRGSMAVPDNTVRTVTLSAPSPTVDIYADIAASQVATGAALNGHIVARHVDNQNYYAAQVVFTTAGTLTLNVVKRVATVATTLATFASGITYGAGTFYRVRVHMVGSTIRAKIWNPTGPEPPTWHMTVADSDLTASANLGFRSNRDAGNTNVAAEIRYDNFAVVNRPQIFTVTRSVNGIVKTHSAGAQVSLASPVYVAL